MKIGEPRVGGGAEVVGYLPCKHGAMSSSPTAAPPQQKKKHIARCRGLMPIILATQEAEIKRITVRSQTREIVLLDPITNIANTKREWLKV
jgi:hypothetical protein